MPDTFVPNREAHLMQYILMFSVSEKRFIAMFFILNFVLNTNQGIEEQWLSENGEDLIQNIQLPGLDLNLVSPGDGAGVLPSTAKYCQTKGWGGVLMFQQRKTVCDNTETVSRARKNLQQNYHYLV